MSAFYKQIKIACPKCKTLNRFSVTGSEENYYQWTYPMNCENSQCENPFVIRYLFKLDCQFTVHEVIK